MSPPDCVTQSAYQLLAAASLYFEKQVQDGWEEWRKAEIGGQIKRWLKANKDVGDDK